MLTQQRPGIAIPGRCTGASRQRKCPEFFHTETRGPQKLVLYLEMI
jgi:hypothetical protein